MRNKIKSFRGESFPASKHSPEHKAAVPENQGVTRVKGVAEILEPLSMIPLPPLVQPNQRQGQHRKSLLRDFESEHGNEDRRNKECIQDNQENELHGNLGAGYGKGDWGEISSLIEGYFAHPSDRCFVVEYEEPPKPAEVPEPEGKPAPAKESEPTEEAKPAEEPKPAEKPQEPSKPAGEPKKVHVQICAMGVNENGASGWGVVLRAGKTDKVLSGGAAKSPAEDMVLTAMISGLAALKWPCKVDLFINSFAIMNAVSSNGGKPIGATALWNQLAEVQAKHTISVHLTDGYDAAVVERCKAAAKEKALVSKAS